MHARIAWVIVGVAAIAVALDTAFTAAHRPLLSESTWADHGWPLATLAGLCCAVMGALILARYPRHPLGWLLCAASLVSVALAAEAYSVWVLAGDGPGSPLWAHVSGWVSALLNAPLAITAVVMVFLISPDGRLPSRRWRWAARVAAAGLALYTLGVLTIRPDEFVYGEDAGYRAVSGPLITVGILLIGISLISSAVSLALRLRRARDETRRQLLWIATSAGLLAAGLVFLLAAEAVRHPDPPGLLAGIPLLAAFLAFPLCTAVAVLRHGLFEIDLIVNRALVLAMATTLVAVGYVLAVVVLGAAVGGGAEGFCPSVLATALVAMGFQPLRRRIVRVADRLAFGASATPYEALSDFSRRLGDSSDPDALLPAVAHAAAAGVTARRCLVRLALGGGGDLSATWPVGALPVEGSALVDVAVTDRGEPLGVISVEMPTGRPLRPREHRLLQDLADQVAIAVRNARMSVELADRVEPLDLRTGELAESRRQLITAGDAERSRLERSIARDVLPHLEPLPDRLGTLASAAHEAPRISPLQDLITEAAAALDALRTITRGVFPTQLARSGLEPALGSLLARVPNGALLVDESAIGRRLPPRGETAAYFCVAEAVRELGPPIHVALAVPGDQLQLVITGRDRGFLPVDNMRGRIEAIGGTLNSRSADGGTVIEVCMPARQAAEA